MKVQCKLRSQDMVDKPAVMYKIPDSKMNISLLHPANLCNFQDKFDEGPFVKIHGYEREGLPNTHSFVVTVASMHMPASF